MRCGGCCLWGVHVGVVSMLVWLLLLSSAAVFACLEMGDDISMIDDSGGVGFKCVLLVLRAKEDGFVFVVVVVVLCVSETNVVKMGVNQEMLSLGICVLNCYKDWLLDNHDVFD